MQEKGVGCKEGERSVKKWDVSLLVVGRDTIGEGPPGVVDILYMQGSDIFNNSLASGG